MLLYYFHDNLFEKCVIANRVSTTRIVSEVNSSQLSLERITQCTEQLADRVCKMYFYIFRPSYLVPIGTVIFLLCIFLDAVSIAKQRVPRRFTPEMREKRKTSSETEN